MANSKKFRGVRQRQWGSWVSEIRHPLLSVVYSLSISLKYTFTHIYSIIKHICILFMEHVLCIISIINPKTEIQAHAMRVYI